MSEQISRQDTIVILGASRGIGREFCVQAVERGYQSLELVSRTEKDLSKLKKELLKLNPKVQITIHSVDLCDYSQVEKLVHSLEDRGAFPRHWIFSFGGFPGGTLVRENYEGLSWEMHKEIVELNMLAPMRILHQLVPELIRPNSDGIVEPASMLFLASQAAYRAQPTLASYAGAKFGLRGFLKGLHEEIRELGIRMSIIAPGMVDTGLIPSQPNLDREKLIPLKDVAGAMFFALECGSSSSPFELHLQPQREPFQKILKL